MNVNCESIRSAREMFPQVLTEITYAEAHFRIHNELTSAISLHSRKLLFYHDFFEFTIFAHFSGLILSCGAYWTEIAVQPASAG